MKFLKNKFNSMLLCMMLIVAMAFTTAGCAKDDSTKNNTTSESQKSSQNDVNTEDDNNTEDADNTEADANTEDSSDKSDDNVLGQGSVKFTFEVVDADGNQTNYEIHTDKETVADALLEFDLIEGEDSEYGIYVKTVTGQTYDYDADGMYWAFYVNGEYAQCSADGIVPTEGDTYSFKAEK